MMPVYFIPEAIEELNASVSYYEAIYRGLGLDFSKEVQQLVDTIAHHPGMFRQHDDGTTRVSTRRFPYFVIYTIHNQQIWILAIAHHRQLPNYWSQRTDQFSTE